MSLSQREDLPPWLSSTSVTWLGALLLALVLFIGVTFLWYEQREIDRRELQSAELLARVLEDQANRTFDTVDVTLSTLAESVRSSLRTQDPIRLSPLLAQAQQGMAFMRSLSLMDASGRVLASSNPDNIDVRVEPRSVPLPGAGSVDRLGPLVAGRDLADVAATAPWRDPQSSRRTLMALTRSVSAAQAEPMVLVTVLNPDYFANQYPLLLADTSRSAALFSVDGMLLAATDNIQMVPGGYAREHRFFTGYLPALESGSYIGPGIDGESVVTAFRTLRHRPISVFVQRDYGGVRAEMSRALAWAGGVCALVITVLGAMLGLAWRSLHGHEAVRTELSRSRAAVEASERDLRSLVESVHELIFRTDTEGRIRFVNPRWEPLTGRSAAAAPGTAVADLCVPEDRDRVQALFRSGAPSAAVVAAMVSIRTVAGETRVLEVSVTAERTAQGEIAGFAGFAVDVSERQSARLKLQSQLAFTARLIEVSPTPLFVKDEFGRFATVNRAWLDLMGLEREQVVGHTSADLFGAEGPMHAQQDERLLGSEGHLSYENRLVRPDRPPRDTVVTKVRFTDADGRPAGIIGSIIDVTEFREAERTTRQARDAAEQANATKSEFIANISHELRTPLQSILGFSELGSGLASEAPEFREMFDDIHAGGRRMLTLVNGLLDVSKTESTVGSLQLTRQDVGSLAIEVVRELRTQAARRELTVRVDLPASPLMADVDGFRLQQVLRNVLANALRFAPVGSCIEVQGVARGAQGTDLLVRDQGPGIPPDELETIFDAFVQSSRTRDGSGGTGLGLTICRKIMSAHGGSITADPVEGAGAVLRIHLPASTQADVPEPAVASSDAAPAALQGAFS